AYVDALIREIELTAALPHLPRRFDTVFFGGGTPSLLGGEALSSLLRRLRACFDILPEAEISLECNPGTADESMLRACRAAGVNRLSVGMQSCSDRLLKDLGRIHDHRMFLDCVRLARAAGFENINADVMHGLPGQTRRDSLETLRAAAELELEHISAYALILEPHTPLHARAARGETFLPDADEVADMQDEGFAYLASRGYERYEISNFARPGFYCRHNWNYWQNGEYLGFGVAAHSAARLSEWTRWANTESLSEYLRLTARGKRPLAEIIRLFPADEMFESVMLGLRLVQGVERAAFQARFGARLEEAYPSAVEALRARGWLLETETHIALTPQGLDMQNAALQFFL
ncbi:MAG: radical SAM family heme chaperone HemW, partial [Clostridia bacterium]|nr:radical SAM family heme chaperone HemW [Clostridia bacterium]